MIIEIPLSSRKYPGLVATVDAHFWEMELHQYKYHIVKGRNTFYAYRNLFRGDRRTTAKLHADILRLAGIPVSNGRLIDHEDGDGLNNLESNLRVVTRSQNGANRRANKNGTSKYLGVSRDSRDKAWVAQIWVESERIRIGTYQSEIKAAVAYGFVAWIHFGPNARLNFPEYWRMQWGVA